METDVLAGFEVLRLGCRRRHQNACCHTEGTYNALLGGWDKSSRVCPVIYTRYNYQPTKSPGVSANPSVLPRPFSTLLLSGHFRTCPPNLRTLWLRPCDGTDL